jgi:hypothetical protein
VEYKSLFPSIKYTFCENIEKKILNYHLNYNIIDVHVQVLQKFHSFIMVDGTKIPLKIITYSIKYLVWDRGSTTERLAKDITIFLRKVNHFLVFRATDSH